MQKRYKSGLAIGKFMPFHKGHELMINYGSELCDNMEVLVSGGTDIPLFTRHEWLRDYYDNTNVSVYCFEDFEVIPDSPLDERGVATDLTFWNLWIDAIHKNFPGVDAIFTNDAYGEELAYRLNVDWVPIDPDRKAYPISGTRIRNNTTKHYNMLTPPAKGYYQRTVAIVGPESTGKSTMTEQLARLFDGKAVHEYGRTLSEIRNNQLTSRDFNSILIGHSMHIEAAKEDNRLVVVDTEALTTYLFSQMYDIGVDHQLGRDLRMATMMQKYDLYIILAPTVKWVNDGTRIVPDIDEREMFFNNLVGYITSTTDNYIIIDDDNWNYRLGKAVNEVQLLLDTNV